MASPIRRQPRRGVSPWLTAGLGLVALLLGVLGGGLMYYASPSRRAVSETGESAFGGAIGPTAPVTPAAEGRRSDSSAPGGGPDSGAGRAAPAAQPTAVVPGAAPLALTPEGTAGPEATVVPTGTEAPPAIVDPAPVVASEDARVEQAMRRLTTDADRVGQVLLLGWAGTTAEQARTMLRELRPGGVVFIDNARTAGGARAITIGLAAMVEEYGLVRPLVAIDHEGGLVQRLEDVRNLGSNRDFARRGASELEACERGAEHARQLQAVGITMNLAPVLDVNNNPNNPVIGSRSYGADPELVARLGSAYIRGLQGGGVVAVGKHFPGHGNTSVDSHVQLPILPHSIDELEQVELVPFRRAIAPGTDLAAVMSAHIVFPAVDPSRMPATLSEPIMTGLLRGRLGFNGLVVSDDLGAMRAITDNFAPGEAAVRAVKAGVDLLIIGGPLDRQRASRDALLAALASGDLPRERLDEAVRRVLRVKARFGLLGGPDPAGAVCG